MDSCSCFDGDDINKKIRLSAGIRKNWQVKIHSRGRCTNHSPPLRVFPREAYRGIIRLTKKLGAISTALALLVILVACPILACPPMVNSYAAHSCCPHQGSNSAPHSRTSAQGCPYLLLEKSRNPSSAVNVPALLPTLVSFAVIAEPLSMAGRHGRIADSTGLFLRLHVLLI